MLIVLVTSRPGRVGSGRVIGSKTIGLARVTASRVKNPDPVPYRPDGLRSRSSSTSNRLVLGPRLLPPPKKSPEPVHNFLSNRGQTEVIIITEVIITVLIK